MSLSYSHVALLFSCQPRSRSIVRTNARLLLLTIHIVVLALLCLAERSDRDVGKPDNSRDNTVSDILATTRVSREQQAETAVDDAERDEKTTEP